MGTADNSWAKSNRTSRPRQCFQHCTLEKLLSPLLLNYERLFLCHYVSHLPQMCFIFHLWVDNSSAYMSHSDRNISRAVTLVSYCTASCLSLVVGQAALEQVAFRVAQVSLDNRHSVIAPSQFIMSNKVAWPGRTFSHYRFLLLACRLWPGILRITELSIFASDFTFPQCVWF
jgi:hypothetical protein